MLSEAVKLALIDKIPTILAACASIFSGYFAYRTHGVAKKTEENTNHLKDELVEAVSKERFAAGEKSADDRAFKANGERQ